MFFKWFLIASIFLVALAHSQNGRFVPSFKEINRPVPHGMMTLFTRGNVVATSSFIGTQFDDEYSYEEEDEDDDHPQSLENSDDTSSNQEEINIARETSTILETDDTTIITSTSKPQRKLVPKSKRPQTVHTQEDEEESTKRRKPVYNTFFPIIFTGTSSKDATIIRRPLTSISNSFSSTKKGVAISTTDIRFKLDNQDDNKDNA